MAYSLDFVKQVIEEFVTTNHQSSIELNEGSLGRISVNKSIFDIESFLVQLRQEYNINNRLDTSIVSQNILKHFNSISPSTAFRAIDYQLNLLHHLANSFLPNKDLFTLIDEFIDKYKNQFTLTDIVLTKTGATRCKTNIRFAVDDLRDLALVLSKDSMGKRCWAPSVMGLVVLLNIQFNIEHFQHHHQFKTFDSLLIGNRLRLSSFYTYDPTLIESLQMFKNPDHLYRFLHQLRDDSVSREKKFLEDIIHQYIDFVAEGLEITSNGVRTTKVFSDKSKKFQQKIFSIEEKNVELHSKLFNHFRKTK